MHSEVLLRFLPYNCQCLEVNQVYKELLALVHMLDFIGGDNKPLQILVKEVEEYNAINALLSAGCFSGAFSLNPLMAASSVSAAASIRP